MLSATKYVDDVSWLVNKELEKGNLIGPFIKLPFDIYRVSPIGIVKGKYSGNKLDDTIKIVKSVGDKSSLSKCDVSVAFKNTPLNPKTWHLFGFKWEDKYYFYTRLCFGCRSSPTILIKYFMWQIVGFCRIIII